MGRLGWLPQERVRVPITVALVGLFVPLVCGTGLLVGAVATRRMAEMATDNLRSELAIRVETLSSNWQRLVDPRLSAVQLSALQQFSPVLGNPERSSWLALLPAYRAMLIEHPIRKAVYLADQSGALFRVTREGDSATLLGPDPSKARFLLEVIVPTPSGKRIWAEQFDYRLRSLGALPPSAELRAYDPRQRPWYQLAFKAGGAPVVSHPLRLALSGGYGVTASRRFKAGNGASGITLRADDLEWLLSRFRLSPSAQLALVDSAGTLLLTSPPEPQADRNRPLPQVSNPALAAMAPMVHQAAQQAADAPVPLRRYRVGHGDWFGAVVPLPTPMDRGNRTYLLVTAPERELMARADRTLSDTLLLTLLLVLLAIPLVVLLARRISAALRQLALQASAIRRLEFEALPISQSHLREVDELALTLARMRDTIRSFLQSSAALGAEPDVERLLERLLSDAIASSCALDGRLIRAEDLSAADQAADQAAEDQSVLRLPLRSRDGELQGLLELQFSEPPDAARVAFCTALSGTAAVALETRSLIAAQKALFEAFIELIAGAIDAKSPYTGGHCARVPELAQGLAEAACAASEGPYAGFQLSEQDWEALHLASWLHDCGKVTTPEYVVDKATKLETIHNRIHEVRMRFELLKAAAETAHWRARAEGGDAAALQAQLEAQWAELDADFAFVAACNQGGEAMAPEDQERLQRIAQRHWRRTLDDRLGLSHDELRRCQAEPEQSLPCLEPLLADRPRHRIPRPEPQRLEPANPWGFTMAAPEWLADHGELHNLSISRGTLTAEERYTINAHIIHTIRMLSALPFPPHLQVVPEIAGGHHERLDGRGYPRSLRGDQMSPLARMMAIADVFEALTAADRPYKSGKPLSVALAIMAAMVREGHLDPDLFDLFVRGGVYRRYAERFLSADQIDAVDEAALLRR